MAVNLYSNDEVTLCCYIARFGRRSFDENDIHDYSGRSLSSIKMKVQNIASMISEHGYPTSAEVSQLTGLPSGESGRKTNWDIVSIQVNKSQQEHMLMCTQIFEN